MEFYPTSGLSEEECSLKHSGFEISFHMSSGAFSSPKQVSFLLLLLSHFYLVLTHCFERRFGYVNGGVHITRLVGGLTENSKSTLNS